MGLHLVDEVVGLAEADHLDAPFAIRASTRIEETVTRISTIVRAMRSLSRQTTGDPMRPFLAAALLEDTLAVCRARFAEGAVALLVDSGDNPLLVGRPAEVGQVLLNLLKNAYDATGGRDGARVAVSIAREGERARIVVEDTGPGVPAELVDQIMEPFFTTKEPGAGTGLGLSISRSITLNHGGELRLEPTSEGARFVLLLPIHSGTDGGS